MSIPPSDDPFHWGVERLSKELCGEGKGWAPASSLKRPDPKKLDAALKQHEIDGETLLTWNDVFESHGELFLHLGIVKAAHRLTIAKAITWLKKHSPAYHMAKAENDKELEDQEMNGQLDTEMLDAYSNNVASADTVRGNEENSALPDVPPQKKRRVAPQLLTTEVQYVGLIPLPTAGDALQASREYGPREPTDYLTSSRRSFLGKGKLVIADHVPRNSLKGPGVANPDDESNEFSWTLPSGSFPPGRQQQMKRGMMRLFEANRSYASQIMDNVAYMDDPSSSQVSSEDRVLPLFGDSDDEYDAETLREMEEEAAAQHPVSRFLSPEHASSIIESVIQEYAERWESRKLPRCQRKAYPIWRSASLKGRNQEILRTTKRLADLEQRISKLKAELAKQDWLNEASLRRQSRCLEASIEDREYLHWLSELLKGREPPRVPVAPRQPRSKRPKAIDLSDDEADFITSDSDASIDESAGISAQPRSTIPLASPPTDSNTLPHPNEQIELPQRPSKSPIITQSQPRDYIDLVTPNASRHADLADEVETVYTLTPEQLALPFTQPQEIGKIDVRAWRQYRDAKRMTISFIWNKNSEWREKVFQLLQTQQPNEIWHNLVVPTFTPTPQPHRHLNPGGQVSQAELAPSDLHFTLARLFWQFAFCDISTAVFHKVLGNKLKAQIPLKQDSFPGFVDFMRHCVIPNFPGAAGAAARHTLVHNGGPGRLDNEVGQTDIAQENIASGDTTEDDATCAAAADSGTSQRAPRQRPAPSSEKVQEDEQQRMDANVARANRFYSRMDTSTTVTKATARLIINISKEGDEDSGFIGVSTYRNQDKKGNLLPSIADRIKDHQIDGVRFMWDHVVANSGCMLAHTMGLGKTMQVITLLVAIREATMSNDEAVKNQVPKELRERIPRFLIICPSGLCDNWRDEFSNWAPSDVFGSDNIRIIDSSINLPSREFVVEKWRDAGGVLIIGYPLYLKVFQQNGNLEKLITETPDLVVADEAHYFKNVGTQISDAGSKIQTRRRLGLTGTPLANNISEFYNTMNWLAPNYLGDPKEFSQLYTKPIEKGLWANSSDAEYRQAKKLLAALERIVAPKTHRLKAKFLQEQLPGKTEFFITVPLTHIQDQLYHLYINSLRQASETFKAKTATGFAIANNLILIANHPRCFYQKLLKERERRNKLPNFNYQAFADEPDGGTPDGENFNESKADHTLSPEFMVAALTLLNRARDLNSAQLSCKVRHLVTILDESRRIGEKVLVFSQSIVTLDYLDNVLRQQGRSLQKLVGETKPILRQNMVKSFNEVATEEVFLISTGAGGVGLNITGASRVVIFDFKWNPVLEQQAIARAYRIGQTKKVVVYRFIAGGTYEKRVHNKAVFKSQLASRVVDKENPKRMAKATFEELIHPVKPVPQEDLTPFRGKDSILDAMIDSAEGSVRAVVLTDAFEEEDTADPDLNAEEVKEVNRMYEINRTRHTDPQRHQQLEQEFMMAQAAPQHQMMADAAARQARQRLQQNPQFAASQQQMLAEAASRHPTNPAMPQPAPNPPGFGPAPAPAFVNMPPDAFHNRPQQLQQQVMPMMAPGSNHRGQQQGRPLDSGSPRGSAVAAPMMASPGQIPKGLTPAPTAHGHHLLDPGGGGSFEEKLSGPMRTFEEGVIATITRVNKKVDNRAPFSPGELKFRISKVVEHMRSRQKHRSRGYLPDKARWTDLIRLAQDPTFCADLLDNKLDIDKLTWGDANAYCESMGYRVGVVASPDPNHLTNALSRSKTGRPAADTPKKGSRAHEDLIAMRHIANRRKHRPLPEWANRALEEEENK